MSEFVRDKIFDVLKIGIEVSIYILVPIGISYINKAKTHLELKVGKNTLDQAEQMAKIIVKSIEQMYPEESGTEKLITATEQLVKWTGTSIPEDKIKLLIEAAVHEMNIVLKPPTQ